MDQQVFFIFDGCYASGPVENVVGGRTGTG